jgi:hypothetical protein
VYVPVVVLLIVNVFELTIEEIVCEAKLKVDGTTPVSEIVSPTE